MTAGAPSRRASTGADTAFTQARYIHWTREPFLLPRFLRDGQRRQGRQRTPPGRIPFTTWEQERFTGAVSFDNRRIDHVPLRPSRTLGPRDNLPATGPEKA
jgi:hypothetical protein